MLYLLALLLVQDQDWLTKENVDRWTKESIPLVEKETGRKFPRPPVVRIATGKELTEALYQDLEPQKIIQKHFDSLGGDKKELLKQAAALLAKTMLGKYCFTRDEVLVIPENFGQQLELQKTPRAKWPDVARYVLFHELVHAADFPAHKIFDRFKDLTEMDAGYAVQAMFEGHADFVAEKCMRALGWDDARIKAVEIVRPGTDPLSAQFKYMYEDGKKFVVELDRRGGRALIEKALARMPEKTAYLYDVDAYLAWLDGKEVKEKEFDFNPVAEFLKKKLGEGWQFQEVTVGPMQLRAALGFALTDDEMKRVQSEYKGGRAFVFKAGTTTCIFAVMKFSSVKFAGDFLDLEEKVIKERKKVIEKQGGSMEILRTDKGTKDDVRYFVCDLAAKLGTDTATYVRVAAQGLWVVECNYMGQTKQSIEEAVGKKGAKDPMEEPTHNLAVELLKLLREAK